MHILALLGAVLGVAVFILFRMHQAATAARDIAEAADDARGLFRRWQWRRRSGRNPIDLVEDPREAACVMMVAVAQSDGSLTERERHVIENEAVNRFGATPSQAEELLARARWTVQDRTDAGDVFRRLAPLIKRTCGPAERADLIAMLRAVANAEARPGGIVLHDISRLQQSLRER